MLIGRIAHRATRFCLAAGLGVCAMPGMVLADNLVRDGGFDQGTGAFWATGNLTLRNVNGAACVDVPSGTVNPWDAIVGRNDLRLDEGLSYRFAFAASGTPAGPVRALVQMPVDPYTSYITLIEQLTPEMTDHEIGFVSPVTMSTGQVAFQIGGATEPWTFCIDNVVLDGGAEVAAYKAETGPAVRVNQVGYLPDGPKRATIVSDAYDPLEWTLEQAGTEIASGVTEPKGFDRTAGVSVHVADFSDVTATGEGFTLTVGDDTSYPFAIVPDLYDALLVDALQYYYPVRSGIEIKGDIYGEAYARPAGHVSSPGAGPNQGDVDVPCQNPEDALRVLGAPWSCDYTLDVTGGWYDAGDHGKYVLNGGISVGQLLATFERAVVRGGDGLAIFGDSTLRIPETGNGVPDLLDEVRWELEWMLKMIVPGGDQYAGMVHHKVHDNQWTGLPMMPHLDPNIRELHRPSTAATLNVAAVTAMGARLYRAFDPAFADTLLEVARSTYAAAKGTPDLYAPVEDEIGGGPYNDTDVRDEFYWAAAELFITTGEQAYHDDLVANAFWGGDPYTHIGMDWAHVAGLANLSLSTAPNELTEPEMAVVETAILQGAERFLAVQMSQPFGLAYGPENYDWGSAHQIIQNARILAEAHELSGEGKFRSAAIETMDYIFGRNALNHSYVTGYGTVFSHNQHSRWFSHQLNTDLPRPPKGALAGGPNSYIHDPVVQRLFSAQGCAPQTCYIDDIESWSTNELTINWNAALAHMAGYLADQ